MQLKFGRTYYIVNTKTRGYLDVCETGALFVSKGYKSCAWSHSNGLYLYQWRAIQGGWASTGHYFQNVGTKTFLSASGSMAANSITLSNFENASRWETRSLGVASSWIDQEPFVGQIMQLERSTQVINLDQTSQECVVLSSYASERNNFWTCVEINEALGSVRSLFMEN